MRRNYQDVISVEDAMESVCDGGLDDDMYESVLWQLRELQVKYNELVDDVEGAGEPAVDPWETGMPL